MGACECSDDQLCHFVLDSEHLVNAAVIAFGPQIATRRPINKLHCYSYPISGPLDAALEDMSHAEFPAHILRSHRLVLVGKARVA